VQALRRWSVRHASGLKRAYDACARLAPHLRRPLQWTGFKHAERLLLPFERATKQLLFDCKMCGQCALSSTGMACPTNCAKQMRNGPCGGVRADGSCEVNPAMRCVWVEAIDGLKPIDPPQHKTFLEPIDHRLWNRSSWLRVIDGTHMRPTVVHAHVAPTRENFGSVRLTRAESSCARARRASDVGQQSDPRSERPAGAGWAALRQFRFSAIPLWGARWRLGRWRRFANFVFAIFRLGANAGVRAIGAYADDDAASRPLSYGVSPKQAALKDQP